MIRDGHRASRSLRRVADGPLGGHPAESATRRCATLADEAFRTATSILDYHRGKLDQLASRLLANEVLERGDIDRDHGRRSARSAIADRLADGGRGHCAGASRNALRYAVGAGRSLPGEMNCVAFTGVPRPHRRAISSIADVTGSEQTSPTAEVEAGEGAAGARSRPGKFVARAGAVGAEGNEVTSSPPCCPRSTTSASPSTTSTPRSSSTGTELGMQLVHREKVAEQGVEAVLLDVGETHVELLEPLVPRHRRRQVPGQARRGAAPRRLPGATRSTTRWPTLATGHAADRRAAANGNPRLPGSLHPSFKHRRRADRDRPARRPTIETCQTTRSHRKSASDSSGARCSAPGSAREELSKLRGALGGQGWHELTAEDGTVALGRQQDRLRARRPRGAPRRLRLLVEPAPSPRVNSVDSTTRVTVRLTPWRRGSARAPAPGSWCRAPGNAGVRSPPPRPCAPTAPPARADRALDRLAADVALAIEVDERLGVPAERGGVDDRRVAQDHAVALEPVDAALDRRRRQVTCRPMSRYDRRHPPSATQQLLSSTESKAAGSY